MFRAVFKFIALFIAATLIFVIGKFVFLASNSGIYAGLGAGDIADIIYHGMSMDVSMAGYLCAIPAILYCLSPVYGTRGIINKILKGYFIVISLVISLVVILDAVLYSYWQFKLDSTPLFYFFSSPSAAFASAEWWQIIVAPIAWIVLAALFYCMLAFSGLRLFGDVIPQRGKNLAISLSVMILFAAALFIPIRGGVTVSTMNLSRAYYSAETRLNHAAVNPAFSLMYSLTHQNDFASQFRFFENDEAARLFEMLKDVPSGASDGDDLCASDSASSSPLLSNRRPDIYILLMESFSSHLFPSLGGEPVALKLDSIARDGLMFSGFFANSFRTDRGIPAVLSAYPGQPTTSIMKFVSKTENLPSLSKSLKDGARYSNTYIYGGDANFTNMKAYLVSAGFDKIISDADFPLSQKLSKWGAHDDVVFQRALKEIAPYDSLRPRLTVIQSSSSHEPFEVPYDDKGRFADKRARAFAFADSCAASFINALKEMPQWNNSLIVVVPDHFGAYPDLENPVDRHKVPLILTGGALKRTGVVATPGSQIDIAATLLSAMDLPHGEFPFSRNILNPRSPHFAFFADPSLIGFVTESDTLVYNLDADRIEQGSDRNLPYAKAFLQTLYDDLSKR